MPERKRDRQWVILGGVGLAVAGWIATALLVGVFVGIGRGVGQRYVAGLATPMGQRTALIRPSATPTVLFADSLTTPATATLTHPAVTIRPPTALPPTTRPATPTPVPTATSTPTPTPAPILVTLPVYQLPTTCALACRGFAYPSSIAVYLPPSASDQLAAYGVAGMLVVGPGGWTGSGKIGAQGNSFASLHPIETSGPPGPRVAVAVEGTGTAITDAASYFASAQVADQRAGQSMPAVPAGIRETTIQPGIIAYRLPDTSVGLGIDGVASLNQGSGGAVFKKMEVTLPLAERNLSTVILDTFIDQNIRNPITVANLPPPTPAPTATPAVTRAELTLHLPPRSSRLVTIPNVGYGGSFGATVWTSNGVVIIFGVVGPSGNPRFLQNPMGAATVQVGRTPFTFALPMDWNEPNSFKFENRWLFSSADVVIDYWYKVAPGSAGGR